jgi:sugar phosphate permease
MTTLFPPITFLKSQWRFLLFGFLLAFFSSPGQTFFISLFSADLRGELGLSHGDFGTAYAVATLASAVTLIPLGRLVDTVRLRVIALFIICGLGLSALFFSTIASVFALVVGIYFMRLSGQGMMTHLYATAMTRRYVAERGRALAVAALGHPMSEWLMPLFVLALSTILMFEWREIWQVTGIIALIIMVPAALLFTQRQEGQDGGGVDSLVAGRDGQHWTRRDMLLHWRFWMLSGLIIAPGFSTTGLFFHQIYFAESKLIPLAQWISGYGIYAVLNILGSFIGGGLTDRFTACRIAPIVVANMALPALLLNFATPGIMVFVFFAGFGIVQGMVYTSTTPIWAEIYGTRHLGGIKAIAHALMVFASAISPVLLGIMIDVGASVESLLLVLGMTPIICGFIGYFAATAARR